MFSRHLLQTTQCAAIAVAGIALIAQPAMAQRNRAAAEPPRAAAIDSTAFAGMRWRHIGPEGNRVSSVAGVDGDRNTYYAGAASGGLWKTTDAGFHWKPIFDDRRTPPSSDRTVCTSSPAATSRSDGAWRPTDAGKSTKMGLETPASHLADRRAPHQPGHRLCRRVVTP
jgi:hypothetical protein